MNIKNQKSKTSRLKKRQSKPRIAKWDLNLYVAGETPKAITAFKNLKIICEEQLKGNYQIKVIDLLKNPQLAHDDQIVVLPTLIRKFPLPERNVIGDLSNTGRLIIGLGLLNERTIQRT